jgi:hypothetical protein
VITSKTARLIELGAANGMKKLSGHDLDRSWSSTEVRELSDRELTILAYQRDRKNLLFFFPQAVILYFAARHLGVFGQVLGWIGIVLFGLFALQNIFNFLVGVFVLLTSQLVKDVSERSSLGWKCLTVLLSFANAAIYFGCFNHMCGNLPRGFLRDCA